MPWLLRWPYEELDAELQKAFEVALHAGTAAALLIALRGEVEEAARGFDTRRAALVALSFLPPAVAGYTLERPIEERMGTPRSIAVGLLLGSAAMALADRLGPATGVERTVGGSSAHPEAADHAAGVDAAVRPSARRESAGGTAGVETTPKRSSARREPRTARPREDAGALDGLVLGLAQCCALVPGASRNGMTLAAARARGFGREDANALSRHVALPIILGASVLKGARLARRGLPPAMGARFAVGAAASFASTLGSTWLIPQVERDRSLLPYAVYRTALAAAVLRRSAR